MAYDVEISTPRGRIGFNAGYNGGAADTVIMGYLQNSDGTWTYKGLVPLAEGETSGTPVEVLRECLKDEGVFSLPTDQDALTWLAATSQEDALKIICRWLARMALAGWVAFANRIIGVVPNPNPTPGPTPNQPFATPEHALRAAFKTAIWSVNATTSEVSARLPT